MSIIRDVQENNDKRDELEIPQVDITPVQQSVPSTPPLNPPQPSIPQEAEPILPVSPPDMNNMEGSVLRNSNLQLETIQQQTAPSFDLMPTVNEVFLQNEMQAEQEVQDQLRNVPGTFVINGDVQPSLYEVTETRSDMFSREFDFIFPKTGEEITKQLVREQYNPGWGDVDFDPMGTPDASVDSSIFKRGLTGILNSVGSTAESLKDFTLGTGEEENFAPLRGFRKLGQEIKENPWNAFKLPLALPLGFAGGQYGEMGDGLLGATFYGISLAQNALVGGASDVYNAINGETRPNEKLNIVQAIQGKDFSFTTLSGEDKPLSFVGGKDNPETFDELKKRSIFWQHPLFSGAEIGLGLVDDAPRLPGVLDIAEAATRVFQSEEDKGKIPFIEKLPNRTVQTMEFVNGMIADAITDPMDAIGNLFQRATKNLDVLENVSEPVQRALRGTDELPALPAARDADALKETRILKGDPELPSVSPETVTRNADGSFNLGIDETVQTVDVPARPVLEPDNQQLSLEAAVNSPNATVGQLEEILGKTIEPPMPKVRSEIIDNALSQVDASSRVIGLLPPSNTTDDIINQVTAVNTNVSDLIRKYDINLDEFAPITRRTNSQLTTDIGLTHREPLSDRRLLLSLPGSKELVNYKSSMQLPRVEYEDTFLTRLLDNSMDEIVDNPNTVPDLINAQKEVLPNNYRVFSTEGQNSLAKTLRNEQVFETFAKESEELQARFVRQVDELHKTMDAVDSLPDVGRRSLDDPLLSGKTPKPFRQVRRTATGDVEVPYQRQPAEFYELDEFDLTDEAIALAEEVNSQKLFHGTKTVINTDFSELDPVLGSSRSEIGTVLHMTNDSTFGSIYAEASPNRNSPPVIGNTPRKIVDGGLVYEVQPQVQNPRLVDSPIDEDDADVISWAIKKTPDIDSRVATRLARIPKKGRSYEEILNKIDDILIEEFDEFPEELALNIQRSITNDVRNVLGIDALVKKGNDGFMQIGLTGVPGRQSTLATKTPQDLSQFVSDVPQTPIQRQAYMKYLGDKTTAGLYPDSKFSQVNELESLVKYQTEELNLTSMRTENAKKVAKITVDELLEQEQQLRQISELEYRKSREAKEVRWKKQNERLVQSYNTVEKGIC